MAWSDLFNLRAFIYFKNNSLQNLIKVSEYVFNDHYLCDPEEFA